MGDHPDVHVPLGQVASVDLDLDPGLSYTVQCGHERVEVVHHRVPVREERAGDAVLPLVPGERADQERPVIARDALAQHLAPDLAGAELRHLAHLRLAPVQPPVHVAGEQVRPLGAHPPDVPERDADLVGHALVEHLGRAEDPGLRGHPGVGQFVGRVRDDDVRAVVHLDLRRGHHDVQGAGPLPPQQVDHVLQPGVPGRQFNYHSSLAFSLSPGDPALPS